MTEEQLTVDWADVACPLTPMTADVHRILKSQKPYHAPFPLCIRGLLHSRGVKRAGSRAPANEADREYELAKKEKIDLTP